MDTLAPRVAAADPVSLAYEADVSPAGRRAGDAGAWRARFEKSRARDLQFRSSLSGPHRDDLALKVGGRPAKDYGSEGQQRSLVLALRLAQVSHVRAATGVEPVLLADDVLGVWEFSRGVRGVLAGRVGIKAPAPGEGLRARGGDERQASMCFKACW